MISFGVATAFIMYFWKLNTLGRFGWLLCLIYVICVALRLARFNVNTGQAPSWRDNFFEGVPSPAGGILVLTPLILSLASFDFFQINYDVLVPIFFVTTSLLLISKFPSYSFKKIVIQRKATIFLLFGIVLFFGLLLIYPFNVIFISAIIYLSMLPISFFHYQKLKKQNEDQNYNDDEEQMKLFNLLSEIKNTYMLITNDDYEKLKSIYIKTKSATITQLLKLKLNVRKNNCMNYVKIFDRFDKKKSEKLKELEKLIENY